MDRRVFDLPYPLGALWALQCGVSESGMFSFSRRDDRQIGMPKLLSDIARVCDVHIERDADTYAKRVTYTLAPAQRKKALEILRLNGCEMPRHV